MVLRRTKSHWTASSEAWVQIVLLYGKPLRHIREDGRGGIRGEITHLLVELDDTRMCR